MPALPLVRPIIEVMGRIIDDVHTSGEEKRAAMLLVAKLNAEPHLGQIEINKIEASHASWFVAGWRPAVGWVCAFALFYAFVLRELIMWGLIAWGYDGEPLPQIIELPEIITITLAMLGLGGVRTFEKVRGVARARISEKLEPETIPAASQFPPA